MTATRTRAEIFNTVKRIAVQKLDVSEADVHAGSAFVQDLGADSIALMELVLEFEKDFEMTVADEDTDQIKTVQNAVDYIAARLNVA